jgi:hypothetical protein
VGGIVQQFEQRLMSGHTPGPWYVDGTDGIYSRQPGTEVHPLPEGITWRVVDHGAIRSRKDHEELLANVRLIAAAPDLESALRWAVNFLETNYSAADMPELVTLRAALDKVKS